MLIVYFINKKLYVLVKSTFEYKLILKALKAKFCFFYILFGFGRGFERVDLREK